MATAVKARPRYRTSPNPQATVKALAELGVVLAHYARGYKLAAAHKPLPPRSRQSADPLHQRALRMGYDDGKVAYACAVAHLLLASKGDSA